MIENCKKNLAGSEKEEHVDYVVCEKVYEYSCKKNEVNKIDGRIKYYCSNI